MDEEWSYILYYGFVFFWTLLVLRSSNWCVKLLIYSFLCPLYKKNRVKPWRTCEICLSQCLWSFGMSHVTKLGHHHHGNCWSPLWYTSHTTFFPQLYENTMNHYNDPSHSFLTWPKLLNCQYASHQWNNLWNDNLFWQILAFTSRSRHAWSYC